MIELLRKKLMNPAFMRIWIQSFSIQKLIMGKELIYMIFGDMIHAKNTVKINGFSRLCHPLCSQQRQGVGQ